MSNMKPEDFRDGMRVTCNINNKIIDDAMLSLNVNNQWFVCHNVEWLNGATAHDMKGYGYSWGIGKGTPIGMKADSVTDLQPTKPAKKPHHRKPSPESELVGSCTLAKKWKWLTINEYGDCLSLFTNKPSWDSGQRLWFTDSFDVFYQTDPTFKLPPYNGIQPSQRLYRRQGDKWVHVG